MNWGPNSAQFSDGNSGGRESGQQGLFVALQDVGLKLEAVKAPVQFLVIDHAEKPSEN